MKLADPKFLDFKDEWGDRVSVSTMSIFPGVLIAQLSNFLMIRQIRPKSPREFELYWTILGYVGDDPELRMMRQRNVAWMGPGGYISMEDSESGSLIQRAARGQGEEYEYIAMGGQGEICNSDTVVSEIPVRAFWRYYCYLMGFAPEGEPPLDRATWKPIEAIDGY